MSETILEVQHLGKSFGNNEILKDIDFSVKPKDVTCIIGPSGSGKSTLLYSYANCGGRKGSLGRVWSQ